MLEWPEFKIPPINLYVMSKPLYFNDEVYKMLDKSVLENDVISANNKQIGGEQDTSAIALSRGEYNWNLKPTVIKFLVITTKNLPERNLGM